MVFLTVFILTIYTILIIALVRGFNRLPEFNPEKTIPSNNFSIIIPFRNEAENLPALLKSFSQLDFPVDQFEILLVNDDSSDDYQSIIDEFIVENPDFQFTLFQNIRNSLSPKKDAIETAIAKARFEWIITTDADCIVPKKWLMNSDAFIQNNPVKMIVAPVAYTIENKFLDHFQNLDFISLQGTTIGSFGINHPFMCNGANLCYTKQAFKTVNGFEGNDEIASGDDVFLMEKILKAFPNQVQYLKNFESVVKTRPQPDLTSLLHQRIRWAAKMGSTNYLFGKIVGIIVFMANIYWILLLFLALFQQISWQYVGLFFLVKLNVDFVLLYSTTEFFREKESMRKYLYSSFIYPFFSVYVAVASLFKGYSWKGRTFKK